MRSLRTKVALFMAVLFAIAFAVVGAISTRIARVEEQRLVLGGAAPDRLQGLERLTTYYRSRNTWAGVVPLVKQLSDGNHRGLLLLDGNQRLLAVSDPGNSNVRLQHLDAGRLGIEVRTQTAAGLRVERLQYSRPAFTVVARGRIVGTVFALPAAPPERPTFAAFNRKLIAALVFVGVLSVLSGLILAQYLLDPIAKLSRAAQNLRAGRYEQIDVFRNDEVGDLAEAFNALSLQLKLADKQRKDLIADIAHELRTPLTNIRCAIEELHDGLVPAAPEAFGSLLDEALHLQRLVEDLHDLSMSDAHTLSLHKLRIDLNAEIATALAAATAQFQTKNVRLAQTLPSESVFVEADPVRLKQIMSNLLSNALRASSDGGDVRVVLSRDEHFAHVIVEDSGRGFDPGHAELLFERFYREEPSRSRDSGGSGLGLALTRQLVMAHGGEIVARSTGHGASFSFTLPLTA